MQLGIHFKGTGGGTTDREPLRIITPPVLLHLITISETDGFLCCIVLYTGPDNYGCLALMWLNHVNLKGEHHPIYHPAMYHQIPPTLLPSLRQ